MSDNSSDRVCRYVERIKLRRKVLYHFTIFVIINEILISKDHRIRASAWPYYYSSVHLSIVSSARAAGSEDRSGKPC